MVKKKQKRLQQKDKVPKVASSNWEKLKAVLEKEKIERPPRLPSKRKKFAKPEPVAEPIVQTVPDVPVKVNDGLAQVSDNISTNITQRLAIDCEMVGTGKQGTNNELARVSVVNVFGDVLYDKIVKPRDPVTDYRTDITGLVKASFAGATLYKVAQKEVADLLKDRIVIGHDVKHDFEVLGFSHPKHMIRDTAKYKPFKELSKGNTPSLKKLAKEVLGLTVQEGVHSSVDDAITTLKLYRTHRAVWERSLKNAKRKNAKNVDQPTTAQEET